MTERDPLNRLCAAALLVLLLCLLAVRSASAKFDPSYDWSTLETEHFLVHFHQDGEAVARRAAAIAEDVHPRLTPRIKWVPREKTRLVLVDAADEANGWATPIPYNVMYLYLTHPAGTQGFGLTSYDDWLRLVINMDNGHPYWAMLAFTFFSIPPTDPLWTAPEEALPVEQGDYTLKMAGPKMIVTGTRTSGQVRWLQALNTPRRAYYRDKYNKFAYSFEAYQKDPSRPVWIEEGLVTGKGTVVLFLTQLERGRGRTKNGILRSHDHGVSWTKYEPVDGDVVGYPCAVAVQGDANYVLFDSNPSKGGPGPHVLYASTDGGRT